MSFLNKAWEKLGGLSGRLSQVLRRRADPLKPAEAARLQELTGFGSNPGNNRLFVYVPKKRPQRPALVVALHGCGQSAAGYDSGSGWSTLADELGFVVLYPQQQRSNNPQGCFSWFVPDHTSRDSGEVLSIRQMVAHVSDAFAIDRKRVFVTGLSAGGAMASAMLATYPEVFAGGAIIAGLPYGCATSVEEAFAAMLGKRTRATYPLGNRVRDASRHRGPWPKISVWHGGADPIVRPTNAEDIVRQWTEVHDLPPDPANEESGPNHMRRVWEDEAGQTVIESYTIPGMGHGVPIALGAEGESCGTIAPFFIPVGISSTRRIAQFWGLSKAAAGVQPARGSAIERSRKIEPAPTVTARSSFDDRSARNNRAASSNALDPNAVIAAAFRAAGLPTPERADGAGHNGQPVAPGPIIAAALKAAGLFRSASTSGSGRRDNQ
jgi:poly(hydroxyalkanoate) depolymerase family esterase